MTEITTLSKDISTFSNQTLTQNNEAPVGTLRDYAKIDSFRSAFATGNVKDYVTLIEHQTNEKIISGEYKKDPTLGEIAWDGFKTGVISIPNTVPNIADFGGRILVSIGLEDYGNEVIRTADEYRIDYQSDLPPKAQGTFTHALSSGAVQFGTSFAAGALAKQGLKKTAEKLTENEINRRAAAKATKFGTIQEASGAIEDNRLYEQQANLGRLNPDDAFVGIQNIAVKTVAGYLSEKLGFTGVFGNSANTPIRVAKRTAEGGLAEGLGEYGAERAQTWADETAGRISPDDLDKYARWSMAFWVGAVLGGGASGYDAILYKQKAFKALDERIGHLIPQNEKQKVYNDIFEETHLNIGKTIIDQALLSETVKGEHKDLQRVIFLAIQQQSKETGAFQNIPEETRSQMFIQVAKQQADITVAEAINRRIPIRDIIDNTKVVVEDGQIYLKGKFFNTPSSKVQISIEGADNDRVVMDDQQPQQEGEQPVILNQEVLADQAVKDGKNLPDIEARNINYNIDTKANRDVVIDVFNAIIPENERASYIDKEGYITPEGIMRVERAMLGSIIDDAVLLKQIVESQDESIKALTKALTDISSVINGLENRTRKGKLSDGYTIKDDIKKAVKKLVKAKLEGKSLSDIDMVDLTPSQKELLASFENAKSIKQIKNTIARYANVVDNVAKKRLFKGKKVPVSKDSILRTSRLHQEQVELADTMKELDRTNEEYTAETININGKERPVYNSEGNRIAKSEKALRAFYEWFGNSKVVDDQGRPLVVYHGTPNKFDTFDAERVGTQGTAEGNGFYFTTSKKFAQGYAKETWVEGERVPGNVMPVYLKIENPLEFGLVNGLRGVSESKIREVGKIISDKYIKYDETRKTFNDVIDFAIQNGKEIDITETIAILQNNAEIIGDEINDTPGYEVAQDVRNIISKEFGVDGFFRKVKGHTVYVAFSPNQIKSVDNRGTFDINNPNIYYQMVGENANLSNKQKTSLDSAKDMEQQGASNREIFAKTGWFKGADGKWRIEISDKDAKINKAVFERLKRGQILVRLNEFFNHEKLFNLYPELKNIAVFVDHNGVLLKNAEAGFTYETNSIKDIASPSIIISKRASIQKLRKTILHEIQHYIQKVENFATGGNLGSFDKAITKAQEQIKKHQDDLEAKLINEKFGVDVPYHLMIKIHEDVFNGDTENKSYIYEELDLDRKAVKEYLLSKRDWLIEEAEKEIARVSNEIPASDAMEYYVKLYGEIEARNTEARMNMSEKARKKSFPEDTQDISNANAIVIFEDGTQMSYKVKEPKQERVVKNYTDRNNPSRITQRTIETLLPEEQNALDSFLLRTNDKERILENLNKNKFDDKGRVTGYYTTTIESIFTQEAVERYFEGKEIDFESTIDAKTSTGKVSELKSILESKQFSSAKTLEDKIKIIKNGYLKGILAHPTKVVNAVNSSLINCDPSLDCAKYCYATKGNYVFISNMPKADVIDLIVKKSPKTIAKWIADEWKQTTEFLAGKALRLFDKGDGSDSWVEVVKELNKQDVRVAIFTKKPDFMRKIKALKDNAGNEINLTMLSIDSTNENLANENKDLNVAYVYQGEQNLEFVKQLQADGRLNVVLPVKLGSDFMSEEDVKTLRDAGIETKRICPIDAGWGKLHKASDKAPSNMIENGELKPVKVGEWNCALCDRNGGVGCFYKKTTKQMKELLEAYNQDVFTNKEEYAILKKGIDELDRLAEQGNITEESLNEIEERYFGKDKSDVRRDNSVLQRDVVHPNSRAFIRFGRIYSMFNERLKISSSGVDNQRSRSEVLQGQGNASLRNNGEPQTLLREREEQRNRTQHDLFGIPETPQGDSGDVLLNLLFQRAYAASRVDYEKPSLKYIGTGEGNQAHGWGLYYALSRDIAEWYRRRFSRNQIHFVSFGDSKFNKRTGKYENAFGSGTLELQVYFDFEDAGKDVDVLIDAYKELSIIDNFSSNIKEKLKIVYKYKEFFENNNVHYFVDESQSTAQVHEVDIPEMPYLLDEDKNYENQSDYVKEKLQEFFKDKQVLDLIKRENGKYAKSQIKFFFENKSENYSKVRELNELLFGTKTSETTPENARLLSELLYKHGIKGITYEGTRDGRCFVIFNPNDIKVIDKFYQVTKAEGIDLNIDTRNGELERLVNLQETTNLGTNTRGDAFDKWVEDKFTKEALDEIENTTIYEAEDILGSMEDANEEIADDPEGNSYGRKEPFTKEEFVEYYKNITRDNVDDRVRERINSTSSDEWSDLELEFGGSYDRDAFFESVQSYIEGVMFDNGFYTTTNKSNKSDSKYIEVYENEDSDEPFARIRISDHYTHNFYGHNININTNNNLRDEMQKLQEAFDNGDFGVEETVWQSLEDKQRKTTLKGFYDLATKSIGITKDADFSTLPHEFAHFWFDNMWSYVESGEASAEYIERFEAVKKFVGLKDGERPTEKHHEKFARAYEKMLLTGTAPNVKIMKVFEEYKEFIEDVYNNVVEVDEKYGEKYEPLTEDMYNFFNSMVGHSLPRSKHFAEDIEANKVMAQKVDEDVDAVIEEEINTIEERAGNYIKMPVQTDNKTGYLTAYNKVTGENVTAGSATLKVEEERAREFVLNNPQQAYDIVMGFAPKPEGYISNLIYKAYIDLQKQLGNTKHRAEVTINKALELRSEGQDISSEQLETDFVKPTNVISTVINRKTDKVAKRNNKTRKELSDYVKKEVRKAWHEGKKPEEIVKKLADKLTVKPREAKLVKSNNDTYAFKNLLKYVEDSLGMGMSTEEAIEIIRIADDMNTNLKNSMSETGNPSIEYFIKLRELENYVNKLAPSSVWRVLVSVIGRGNLLASLKSPVTNIVSTLPTNIFMAGTRRLVLGVNTSIVDPKLVKQARKEAWEIYKQTGYHLFSMEDVTKGTRGILGENLSHSQGEGAIRALGRFYEKLIYDFSLGRPDVMFKNFTFTDYASLKATKLSGVDKKKANELFEDACRVEPLTDEGKEIRKEAVNEALVATYQNKGFLSETLLKMRDTLNFNIGFGEFLVAFVKTPANIIETSLNMAFGIPRAIISQTVRDIQRGRIFSPWTQENVRLCVENGLGVLLAMVFAAGLDDDDYMPAYALATEKDKQLAKELNIPYNSIRIDGIWYSLDYLGVLAAPLVSVLQARKSEDIMGKMWGYAKGGLLQASTLPVVGSIADVMSNIQTTLKKEGEDVAEDLFEGSIQTLYNRLVPMIVTDIAKALDPYEREKSGFGIQQNIPFAREELPKKVSVTSGEAEKLGHPLIDLFAGARVKEPVSNDVADELKRLNDAGFGVTLKDVTKGTKFSDLDEETKQEVRVRYAEEYSERVSDLINSDEYQELEDAEKSQAIGKIRTKIMKELREEFL